MTPANILSSAREFLRGFELCVGNGLPADNGQRNAVTPGAVCLAFAAELALKSILFAEDNQQSGHDLRKLLGKLSEKNQQLIRASLGVSDMEFSERLDNVARAFEEWRYLFENVAIRGHHLDIPFLEQLCRSSITVADPLTREWMAQHTQT